MLNGDISNYTEYIIAFRIDDFLIEKVKGGFFRPSSFKINERVAKALKTVYFKTPYTVDLVYLTENADEEKEREKIESFLIKYDIPYGNIHIIKQDLEVRTLLTVNAFSYYIDSTSLERVDRIGKSDYVLSLEDLYKMISKRV